MYINMRVGFRVYVEVKMTNTLRLVRMAPPPLGMYFRIGAQDRQVLLELVAERRMHCNGVVIDPRWDETQAELMHGVNRAGLEVVLDPRVMEIDSVGGNSRSLSRLPWAATAPRSPQDLLGGGGLELVRHLADRICSRAYTSILAPTHFIQGANDPWLHADGRIVELLRSELDRRGRHDVQILYPLALSRQLLIDHDERQVIIGELESLPINAVWLRIHPFGGNSGPLALRTVIEGCADFRLLDVPVVAERAGVASLAMLAFGAISGIASGIGIGENFDAGRLLRPPSGRPGFQPHPRVYISDLGVSLETSEAVEFFSNQRARAHYACRSTECCRLGADDMVAHPRRHFAITKMREIAMLSRIPTAIRASEYMERILRPMTDRLVRVGHMSFTSELQGRVEEARKGFEKWRATLGRLLESTRGPVTAPPPPELRVVRMASQRH